MKDESRGCVCSPSSFRLHPSSFRRKLVRLLLTTLGRGGEGRGFATRSSRSCTVTEFKEASGNFMEEWHQKMHNNTTPDDVVICEAYLAFLRSDGDQEAFHATLEGGRSDRRRLESLRAADQADPEFYPDKKRGHDQGLRALPGDPQVGPFRHRPGHGIRPASRRHEVNDSICERAVSSGSTGSAAGSRERLPVFHRIARSAPKSLKCSHGRRPR